MNHNLSSLQNGSDIRGVALALPGGPPVTLSGDTACRIASAFARHLARRLNKPCRELKIGVGHDSRLTAAEISSAALRGIAAEGAAGFYCGLASTPSMFCSTLYDETRFDGAVMITASHLPKERNGLKFFDRSGGFDKADIRAILAEAEEITPSAAAGAQYPPVDLISLYSADLREKIIRGAGGESGGRPLSGLHIVVDAGSGAGGFFAEKVLAPLGADISGSLLLSPDGSFPGHPPNPEDKTAMAAIREAVLQSGADLGIIFDTDVDRMSAVLPDGSGINRDAIIAMMAAVLAPEHPGGTIVTDSVTSDRLTRFLEEELGLRHHRFRRGYKNVINEAVRLNAEGVDCPLAIETSGHGALRENHFLDDGAYMAVRLIIAAARAKREGKSLGALIERLPPLTEDCERRIPIAGENFAEAGRRALELFEANAKAEGYAVAPNSYEGVRLSLPEGWALLRMSLHDPLLPLNMESNQKGGCAVMLGRVASLLKGAEGLDLSVLK